MPEPCPDPELCRRLGLHIHGRLWQIWQGEVLTPAKCAAYRAAWERQAQERQHAKQGEPGHDWLSKLARVGKAAARHVAAGLPTLPPEQVEARLTVCRGCEHYEAAKGTCKRCDCHLRIKASWALEACPLGLW